MYAARPALVVGAGTLASRVLGFVRDMLMAWLLGGGPLADALVAALQVPHVLRRLLAEGSLSMTLTACLVRKNALTAGRPAAPAGPDLAPPGLSPATAQLALAMGWRLALGLGLGIGLAEVAARPLIGLLAPGLAAHPDTAQEAVFLLRICLPYGLAAGLAALSMALLHSMGRFLAPALSPACFNLTIISFALLSAFGLGNPATMLAWGFLAGGFVQWLVQTFSLWRMGLWREAHNIPPPPKGKADSRASAASQASPGSQDNQDDNQDSSGTQDSRQGKAASRACQDSPSSRANPDSPSSRACQDSPSSRACQDSPGSRTCADSPDSRACQDSPSSRASAQEARACLRLLPAGLLGAAAPQLSMLCAMMAASFLTPGAMAALYYAERLLELPMSLTGTTLGIVSLPALAALAGPKDSALFARHCARALRLCLLLALPAAAGLLAVGHPLITVLLGHGAFDSLAVHHTTLALCGYALGLPAYALTRPLLAACSARKALRLTACSGVAAVLCTLAAALLAMRLLPVPYAVLGPPLGVSAGLSLQAAILLWATRRALPGPGWRQECSAKTLASLLLGSVLTFAGAKAMVCLFSSPVIALCSGMAVGAGLYILSLWLLHNQDFHAARLWYRHRHTARRTAV